MRHLHLVRPVKPISAPYEKHAAKVIALRARREARAELVRARAPRRPDAA